MLRGLLHRPPPTVTGNYGTTTRSEIEWFFCTEPTEQSLQALGIIEWPREEKLIAGCQSHLCRKPLPLSTFSRQLALANEKLTVFHSHVGEDEFLAGRLYTGPMFVKYNAILRGIVSPISFFQEEYHRLCLGNTYATTLHTINSALAKLSLLTKKTTVRCPRRPTRVVWRMARVSHVRAFAPHSGVPWDGWRGAPREVQDFRLLWHQGWRGDGLHVDHP